jgi:hypothetical protein
MQKLFWLVSFIKLGEKLMWLETDATQLSNKPQEGVVYGQYTTAKGCS